MKKVKKTGIDFNGLLKKAELNNWGDMKIIAIIGKKQEEIIDKLNIDSIADQ